MKRRTFVAGMAAVVVVVPRGVEAQQPTNAPRVDYLGGSSPKVAARWQDAFRRGLRELGYVEGQSIIIEWRSAEGHPERLPELTTELVRLNLAAIVTSGDDVTAVVKRATATIPIVMATSSDPVALGYASSLAFPGGNITGLSGQLRELPVKRVQLIKELLPKAERFGHLTRPDSNIGDIGLGEFDLDANARAIGLTRQIFRVDRPGDLESIFAAMARQRVDAVMVGVQSFTFLHRQRIAELALAHKIPAIGGFGELPAVGGLVSYGVDSPDLWRRAASYVDKILKGAKPANLPIEQPTKFELVINAKTARALGLTIPPSLLLRADQVIE